MAGGDVRAVATSPLANTEGKTRPFWFSDPAGCPRSGCRRPDLWAIIKPAEAAASARQMPGTLHVLQPPPACWATRAPALGASRDHPGVWHHEVLDVPHLPSAERATPLSPCVGIASLVQHQLSASCKGTSGVGPPAGRSHSPRPVPCMVLEGGVKSWQSCSGRFP